MSNATGAWATYERWNDAVIQVMYPEIEVPEPVYLDFEDEQIEQLATLMALRVEDVEDALVQAVVATLEQGGPATIFQRHMTRLRRWVRGGRSETPPFGALLATFCLAAEQMQAADGMSSSNYFGRLRVLLGWPDADHRLDQAYRRVAERMWGELNRWLLDLDGSRGMPTAFALNHRFVGLTVSQALVRSADRDKLRDFFQQYGFAPGAEVAPSELEIVLESWISQRPCPVSSGLERLWRTSSARPRISQAASVTLAGWDGQVRDRVAGGSSAGRGRMVLTLEMGSFPRRRLAVQALLYLPQPGVARSAVVETADPHASVDLVPDLPGALSLDRASALDSADVLEGLLSIRDSLTGQCLEHRPRRLVLFREDELSKRWIESPQVMLGENVRLLVHESLTERVDEALDRIARPGWLRADPYPGQPESWVLYDRVEVFNHPGDLVRTTGMDDLAPLVPLTTNQLKIAGGFALPGRVRGKWHSWAAPEIRAVSDAPDGFTVRLVDLERFADLDDESDESRETVLEEWDDEGAGVVVRAMSELELEDGDYRVEMWARGADSPMSSTTVLLRSADTPDLRQWALLDQATYSSGLGVLGVPTDSEGARVSGVLVTSPSELAPSAAHVPTAPTWDQTRSNAHAVRAVRLTRPDPTSCIHTGRHVEMIETVPTDKMGKPLVAWSSGRCKGCGLERRYPTRLRRSSFGGRRCDETPAPIQHDLSTVDAVDGQRMDWTTAFDALLHTGGGSWSQLERIAFQLEPSALFLDDFARTLESLGHIDLKRHPQTMAPVAWEVAPTSLAGTQEGFLFSGYWPTSLYTHVGIALEDRGVELAVSEADAGVSSYFALAERSTVDAVVQESEVDVVTVDLAWRDLASVLPPLSELRDALPRESDALMGDITWFDVAQNCWVPVPDLHGTGAYRVRRFSVLDVYRAERDVANGTVARSTVQLGKHLAALERGTPLMSHDPETEVLSVPLGADLPGLYGRTAVAASGCSPVAVPGRRSLTYADVPAELARHLYDLLSR